MCIRTVDGEAGSIRTVDGEDGSYRTVDGEDYNIRNVSGINSSGGTSLLGTTPTSTSITTVGTGTYTSPPGCIYIQVHLVGPGGGGAGGIATAGRRSGGGGGAGGCSINYYLAGSYSYSIAAAGTGGSTSANGNTSVGSTFFDTKTVTAGAGGVWANGAGSFYGGAGGTYNDSIFPMGLSPATSPGAVGANGGSNFITSFVGRGVYSSTIDGFGAGGSRGAGGGGGLGLQSGGTGSTSYILIYEYY